MLNGALAENPKYTGQTHDIDTDLYYYNARYYDPTLGRFLQADSVIPSVFQPQTINPYSYVINNPLKYIDPSGHETMEVAVHASRELHEAWQNELEERRDRVNNFGEHESHDDRTGNTGEGNGTASTGGGGSNQTTGSANEPSSPSIGNLTLEGPVFRNPPQGGSSILYTSGGEDVSKDPVDVLVDAVQDLVISVADGGISAAAKGIPLGPLVDIINTTFNVFNTFKDSELTSFSKLILARDQVFIAILGAGIGFLVGEFTGIGGAVAAGTGYSIGANRYINYRRNELIENQRYLKIISDRNSP